MLKIGDYQVFSLVESRFYLDGGAMFGIVPKIMWEKYLPSNDRNLVPLDCNLLLVKGKGKNVLIDSGLGDVLTDKERIIYSAYNPSNLEVGLLGLGVKPEEIDFVIVTHLHGDHVCGAIKKENGKEILRFKNAKIVTQQAEWKEAQHPDERSRAGYLFDHLSVLGQNKVLELVEGDAEILPGIRVTKTSGHSEGHQAIEIGSNGQKLVFYGDVIPTSYHLKPHYVPSLDLYPRESMKVKKKIIPEIIEQGWYIAFDHDIKIKIAKLKRNSDGIIVAEPVVTS
ncbi:MAG: MBL fold metallo-hydrolase [candidate division Zixibacteria bacterium]|nr:MBL fold metallo-hydrolase [candidate division Zixibacteria bacterium]